ncbi:MAG: GNAT family N-acetyltransferase [Candidatus Thorarchaeota archaeon]
MNYQVNLVTENELNSVIELNKTALDQWKHYDYDTGFTSDANWEDLTIYERWMHGGPRCDVITFNIHFNIINSIGKIFCLSDSQGNIIGDIEYIVEKNQFTKIPCAYLLWIFIHPNHRRTGAGQFLLLNSIKKLQEEIPEIHSIDSITNIPEIKALLTKLKFNKANIVFETTIDIKNFRSTHESFDIITIISNAEDNILKSCNWGQYSLPTNYILLWLKNMTKYVDAISNHHFKPVSLKQIIINQESIYFAYDSQLYLWIPYKYRFNTPFLELVFDNVIRVIKEENPDKATLIMHCSFGERQELSTLGYPIENSIKNDYLRLLLV